MHKVMISVMWIAFVSTATAVTLSIDPNREFLPEKMPVYIKDDIVMGFPQQGFERKTIPTNSDFREIPGCYIACYSNHPGIYQIQPNIYVHGMIRVAGKYKGYLCEPSGFDARELKKAEKFVKQCAKTIPSCKEAVNGCWAGGDTEGWFTTHFSHQQN